MSELINDVREEVQVLSIEVQLERITPYINKTELIAASPFSLYIENMLADPDLRNELIEFAKQSNFAEMPNSDNESHIWLNVLLDQVGEEWLYRMVKNYED